MFARRRKRQSPSPTAETGPGPEDHERRSLLERWRQSEQRVTSAWDAWQAADQHDSGDHYDALMDALAEEEKAAAEIERRTVGPLA